MNSIRLIARAATHENSLLKRFVFVGQLLFLNKHCLRKGQGLLAGTLPLISPLAFR